MAIKWLREIDKATKVENLSDDGSFETLSAKIFSGIFDILPTHESNNFKRQMELEDEKYQQEKESMV